MRTVIIIPTYNERENIGALIEALGQEHSILIVDDNSPDGTADVVRSTMEQWNNLTILSGSKEGLGRAYLRGIDHAIKNLNADIIVQMDADFSHDPKDVPRLLAEIKNGHDLAIGSRYIKGGALPPAWALHRKVLSWTGNFLVRLFTGIWEVHEFTTSFRAFTAGLYQKMNLENFGFADNTFLPAFVIEARRSGAKIKRSPLFLPTGQEASLKLKLHTTFPIC